MAVKELAGARFSRSEPLAAAVSGAERWDGEAGLLASAVLPSSIPQVLTAIDLNRTRSVSETPCSTLKG